MRLFRLSPLLVVGGVGLAACSFDVDNPGRILESDLNTPEAVNALVTGMSADFSEEYDGVAFIVARATDDMAGSGSYNTTNFFRVGIINPEDIDGEWEGIQRGRWVAEDGIRRMRDDIPDFTFDGSDLVARAYLFAGLANRVVGESFCFGVVSADAPLGGGGEAAKPPSESFQRALNMLQQAVTQATAAGDDDLLTAAHGGRAQAYVGLGDWANAVMEAQLVPTDFVIEAIFSENSDRENNEIFEETHQRQEMSVYDTYMSTFDPPDPRAPYNNCPVTGDCPDAGSDGITEYWRQEKFPGNGSNIPTVKGTEMRLIEAEATLRAATPDIATAMAKINEVRQFYGVTLPDLTAATLDEAWIHLDHERHLTLWLEGRRMHDLRRWDEEDRSILPGVRYLRGQLPLADDDLPPELAKRASCIPISFSECLSNVNLQGSAACSI
jgi:hypothetical protein